MFPKLGSVIFWNGGLFILTCIPKNQGKNRVLNQSHRFASSAINNAADAKVSAKGAKARQACAWRAFQCRACTRCYWGRWRSWICELGRCRHDSPAQASWEQADFRRCAVIDRLPHCSHFPQPHLARFCCASRQTSAKRALTSCSAASIWCNLPYVVDGTCIVTCLTPAIRCRRTLSMIPTMSSAHIPASHGPSAPSSAPARTSLPHPAPPRSAWMPSARSPTIKTRSLAVRRFF